MAKKKAVKKATPVKVTNVVETKHVDDDDDKWKREHDARSLAEAAAIKTDKKRMKGAKIAAKEMAKEKAAELKGLKSVFSNYDMKKNKEQYGY